MIETTTNALLEQLAVFTEKRHSVLAGNVANIDTPAYRTRDLPVDGFRERLATAVKALRASETASAQDTGAVSASDAALDDLRSFLDDGSRNITFHDGANRSVEHEMTEMMKNMMLQQAALQLMNHQFSMLGRVLSERVA